MHRAGNSSVATFAAYIVIVVIVGAGIGSDKPGSQDVKAPEPARLDLNRAGQFDWSPPWRHDSDCGPSSLYILMALCERDVSIDQVSKTLTIDPVEGCSLSDIAHAAEKLDFAVEIRFVTPEDLTKMRPPYILHSRAGLKPGAGHFTLVVGYSETKKQFAVIDTTYEEYRWQADESLYRGFSGYVLLPSATYSWPTASRIAGIAMILIGIATPFTYFHFRKRAHRTDRRPHSVALD